MEEQHWRYSALSPRFWIFDVRSVITIPIFLVHWSVMTGLLVVFSFLFFWLLERRGIEIPDLMRLLRLRIGGLWRWPVNLSNGQRYGWRLDHY